MQADDWYISPGNQSCSADKSAVATNTNYKIRRNLQTIPGIIYDSDSVVFAEVFIVIANKNFMVILPEIINDVRQYFFYYIRFWMKVEGDFNCLSFFHIGFNHFSHGIFCQ